jgi:hypothetical protein
MTVFPVDLPHDPADTPRDESKAPPPAGFSERGIDEDAGTE